MPAAQANTLTAIYGIVTKISIGSSESSTYGSIEQARTLLKL